MRSLFFLFVAALSFCPITAVRSAPLGNEKVSKPLFCMYGGESNIAKASYYRIESHDAWRQLWMRQTVGHQAGGKKPYVSKDETEVDFERCLAIAFFQGSDENCAGLKVHSILEKDDQITVQVAPQWYATGANTEAHKTSAWGMCVLPRSAKRVVIELGKRVGKDDPYTWVKVAELKAGNVSLEK